MNATDSLIPQRQLITTIQDVPDPAGEHVEQRVEHLVIVVAIV